jgi:hypothetical protein
MIAAFFSWSFILELSKNWIKANDSLAIVGDCGQDSLERNAAVKTILPLCGVVLRGAFGDLSAILPSVRRQIQLVRTHGLAPACAVCQGVKTDALAAFRPERIRCEQERATIRSGFGPLLSS